MSTAVPERAAVVTVSVTEQGRALARRLPYPNRHGRAAEAITDAWVSADAIVAFLATGAVLRIVAPLLSGKDEDPAVICVDDSGQFVLPLLGGHHGRGNPANDLARQIAATLGAVPVVTTATDVRGLAGLDTLGGFAATGSVAQVSRALLDGLPVAIDNPLRWPLPRALESTAAVTEPAAVVRVDDRWPAGDGEQVPTVTLHPPSLVVGVGADTYCSDDEIAALLRRVLVGAGLAGASVSALATLDRRRGDAAVIHAAETLGVPVIGFSARDLEKMAVPNPSHEVAAAVGIASVAEAAALAEAGPGSSLVVTKTKAAHATAAVARRGRPKGWLRVVGLGPGAPEARTAAAQASIVHAEVVVGYGPYLDLCSDLLSPAHEVHPYPIGAERERCERALEEAARGRRVALVCSGDPSLFAMAPMVLELAAEGDETARLDIEMVPGVSAAYAAAALVGAPLSHDHAVISLSDLTTPWSDIAARLEAAAASGMAVALYNPRSATRAPLFEEAMAILGRHLRGDTPIAVVRDATRPGQKATLTTLSELRAEEVDMTTCVLVGSPATMMVEGRMVTPRGRPVR